MHVQRDFELVEAAMRALFAQKRQRLSARIAFPLFALNFEALAAQIFVVGEFFCVRRAAFGTQKRARRLGFQPIFLQSAPHHGLRRTDFLRDLRSAESTRGKRPESRFIERKKKFAHASILNQNHVRVALTLHDFADAKRPYALRLQMRNRAFDLILRDNCDHTDAHIECGEHFALLDMATLSN